MYNRYYKCTTKLCNATVHVVDGEEGFSRGSIEHTYKCQPNEEIELHKVFEWAKEKCEQRWYQPEDLYDLASAE